MNKLPLSMIDRRARRKDLDLPVANAALTAKVDEDGTLSGVRIVVGGMESSFPGARASQAALASSTMRYLEKWNAKKKSVDREALSQKAELIKQFSHV